MAGASRGHAWPAALVGVLLLTATAQAQEASPPARPRVTIGGGAPPAPCVAVDIAGHRAGQLDCATQALDQAARDARRQAEAARATPVAGAGSPDVQVGVASRAGTRLRLRGNFGRSVRPPAVPKPVYPTPGPRR